MVVDDAAMEITHVLRAQEHLMNTLRRRILEFILRDDGPTAVEYAVLLAVIAVAALTAMATFGQRVDAIYVAIRGVMETV